MWHQWRFEAIGVPWSVDTVSPLASKLQDRIRDRIAEFDAVWSRFRRDSLVAELTSGRFDSTQRRSIALPVEAHRLGKLYWQLYRSTGGAVTPFGGAALTSSGYGARSGVHPPEPATADTLTPRPQWGHNVWWEGATISATQPVEIDIGAAGKGLLVDIVHQELLDAGQREFVVDASGDIRHHGVEGTAVALEDPTQEGYGIGRLLLNGQALCSSATNRRRTGSWHHVLDGRDGRPTRDVIATWALAPSAMLADGIATAAFFVPPDRIHAEFGADSARILADGAIEATGAFLDAIFFTVRLPVPAVETNSSDGQVESLDTVGADAHITSAHGIGACQGSDQETFEARGQ